MLGELCMEAEPLYEMNHSDIVCLVLSASLKEKCQQIEL